MADAGWYADPTSRFEQRYWDGAAWTEHVFGPNGQSIDQQPAPAVPQGVAQQSSADDPYAARVAAEQAALAQQSQPAQHSQPAQQAPFDPYAARAAAVAPVSSSLVPAYAQGAPGALTIRELQPALARTQLTPRAQGNGTVFGEPILVLSFGTLPGSYEWWTPTGVLVAVAHTTQPVDAPPNGVGAKDQLSGSDIGSQYDIYDSQSRFLGRSSRLIAKLRHSIAIDDAHGNRIATLKSDKFIATKLQMTLESSGRGSVGSFAAADRKAEQITFADSQNAPVAVVHTIGSWDTQRAVADLQKKNRLFTSVSDHISDKIWDAMTPEVERICCAVAFERPPTDPLYGPIALFAPLLMEQMLSLR